MIIGNCIGITGMGGSGVSPLGTIYSASSWANTSDFTNVGSTQSVVSNRIRFTGGTNDFTKFVYINRPTALENWTLTGRQIIQTKGASSFGLAFGFRAINQWGYITSFAVKVDLSNGANSGKAGLFSSFNFGAWTQQGGYSSAITFSDGDEIETVISITNVATLTYSIRNVTTGGPTVTVQTTIYLSLSVWAIYNLGGTLDLSYLKISSTVTKGARLICVGDSKTKSASPVNFSDFSSRYGSIIGNTYPTTHVLAGPSDRTVEFVQFVNEVISLQPRQVMLNIGRNDLASGVSSATWQANYASIVTSLTNAGIRVIHLLPITTDNTDQTALRTWILANYNSSNIIDPPVITPDTDGVHPTAAAHAAIASTIISSGKIT